MRPLRPGEPLRLPRIDFSREEALLAASGPRSSSGYAVEVVRVVEERGRIVVTVRERTPSLARPGTTRLTFPFALLVLPRSDKPVYLNWAGRP